MTLIEAEFEAFDKIPRFHRDIIITEKIDGTNAQILIDEDGKICAGSRKKWITPEDDNFGFARWVAEHADGLRDLGPGRHFGEWWGKGIQRNYSQPVKRFSLFNTSRWAEDRPECCDVVPVLYEGPFSYSELRKAVSKLSKEGSLAAPGFMDPEGVVLFHTAANSLFKVTVKNDEVPKGFIEAERSAA